MARSLTVRLTTARRNLALWLEAEEAVARGQSYTIYGQQLTRVDADTILKRIQYWQAIVSRLENGGRGGITTQFAVPHD